MKFRFDNAQWVGAICVVLALAILFIWIPLDVESGILEKVRRRVEIGDAMAPTLAGSIILIAGLLLFFTHYRESGTGFLSAANLGYLFWLFVILIASLSIMRWAGELIVGLLNLVGSELGPYRNLRDTVPWKFIGFFFGGTGLIAGLIYSIERRFNLRAIGVAISVTLFLIVVYDLPFDDLILPPNGDV